MLFLLFLIRPVSFPLGPHRLRTGFCLFLLLPQCQSSEGFFYPYMFLSTSVYSSAWNVKDAHLVIISSHDLGHLPRDKKKGSEGLGQYQHPTPYLTSCSPSYNNWIRTSSPIGVHFFASKPDSREHLIPWQRGLDLINFSLFSFESLGIHTHTHIHAHWVYKNFNSRWC